MRLRTCLIVFVTIVVAVGSSAFRSTPAEAGTVCGTVRDDLTAAPIEHAGVFVHEQGGAYAGFHGTSDANGEFCIDGIPAGTYDLVVRRDDYQLAIVPDVEVTDGVTGVDVGIADRLVALAPPWPNPARHQVSLRMQAPEAGALKLSIHDAQGRLLRGWKAQLAAGETRTVTWNFRDFSGRTLSPGTYFARLRGDQWSVTRAIVHVR